MRLVAPPASILCYHSVTNADLPSASGMHVPDDELIAAIDVVRRVAEIVPLRELIARHRAGRATRGLAAFTFDDAYAALPTAIGAYLARTGVPITIFVTTAATERGARFWWDRVDDVFPRVTPDRWRAFERQVGVPESYRTGQPPEFGPLRPFRQWMLATHRGRWPEHLEDALAALEREHASVTRHRAMTWDEIVRFAASAPVDIGVHTVSHPVLPLLGDEELVGEVAGAYRTIRERAGAAVPMLAIPFGLYDARTARLAREAGMQASLTLANRSLRGVGADELLPRYSMGRGLRRWKLFLRLTIPRGAPPDQTALPSATT